MYQVLSHLKEKGTTSIAIGELSNLMQNIGKGSFSYDILKTAYDSDPKVKKIVKNFNKQMVELQSDDSDDILPSRDKDKDSVSNMAKRATDLSDLN